MSARQYPEPYKTGVLKKDVYFFNYNYSVYLDIDIEDAFSEADDFVLSEEDMTKVAEKVRKQLYEEGWVCKGTPFVCYKMENGESWSDKGGYGFYNMSAEWAAKYLENIKETKS